jgi:fatty-acyl-CoA synthase
VNITSLIDYHARCRPGDIALEEHETERCWTWADLSSDLRRVASVLAAAGLRPGHGVAVLGRNSAAAVRSFYGAAALGCYVVPVNTRYTAEEVLFVVRDSGCSALIFDAEFEKVAAALIEETPGLRLISSGEQTGTEPASWPSIEDPGPLRDPEPRATTDLFTIIYTSGSTGRPKGVPYHNRLYYDMGFGLGDFFELSTTDCALASSPFFHLSGQLMLATSLAVGAKLATIARWSPEALLRAIQDRGVTYLHMITTVMVDITKIDAAICAGYDTSRLRQTWCGGGAIGPDLIAAYEGRVGGAACEGWGRSEGGMSWNSAAGRRRKVGTQGAVLSQICELRIVDPDGNDVPAGDEGEILVRGDTVIPAYWRRPDLDAELIDAAGWMRTGDMARLDADGFVLFLGRADHMIKTGGENVYPAEVEGALLDLAGVREVAVVGLPDERLGQRVAAAVVVGSSVSSRDVEEWGRAQLAGYKRPRTVVLVDSVPRLANQKIDYPAVRRLLESQI